MRQLKITKQVTNRDTASLDKYLQEIGRVDLITAEEEVELAQKIKAGDKSALEKLTKANLRFVVSVAKQYQNQGLTLPDLINEGNLGLIKAAKRFDETRGFKFISYAVWWIRQSILQALAEQSRIVRLPLNKIGSINKINKAFARLEQEFERPPTAEEIAETPDVVHPLVLTHDETGEKALYFNSNRTDRVVGLERAESDWLLDHIHDRMIQHQYRYDHDWRIGDIVVWDNRCLIHSVNVDYPVGQPRIHLRTLIKGDRPQ